MCTTLCARKVSCRLPMGVSYSLSLLHGTLVLTPLALLSILTPGVPTEKSTRNVITRSTLQPRNPQCNDESAPSPRPPAPKRSADLQQRAVIFAAMLPPFQADLTETLWCLLCCVVLELCRSESHWFWGCRHEAPAPLIGCGARRLWRLCPETGTPVQMCPLVFSHAVSTSRVAHMYTCLHACWLRAGGVHQFYLFFACYHVGYTVPVARVTCRLHAGQQFVRIAPSDCASGSDAFPPKSNAAARSRIDEAMGPWLCPQEGDVLLLDCVTKLHRCFHYDVDSDFVLHSTAGVVKMWMWRLTSSGPW